MILFLNENDLSVSFLNLWGVRSQCCDVHPCSSATADLSLATRLKTAVLLPFFLTRNAFIKTWNRCVFLHPHPTRLFRLALQLCLGTRRVPNERGKDTSAKWASVEQRDAVRLYVSKTIFPVHRHCAHGARSDRVIINKCTRNCTRVCRQLSHEITKKAD